MLHQAAGDGWDVDPAGQGLHLQAAAVVLGQDRHQAVVGVLADAPRRCGVVRGRG